jgi:glycerol-3-phosphate acyltransferase PlsY
LNGSLLPFLPAVILSYLAGSFPTSILVSRMVKGIDIRQHGSGNAGGTNVLRVVGWKAALLVALVDVGKGWLAAAVISRLVLGGASPAPVTAMTVAGAAAVVGHIYPLFAGFRGGKGVGTTAGMMIAVHPLVLAACAPVFFVTVLATRMVSLGSVLAAASFPLLLWAMSGTSWVMENPWSFGIVAGLALLIVVKHRSNLLRIRSGTENRLGRRRSAS